MLVAVEQAAKTGGKHVKCRHLADPKAKGNANKR